MNMPGPENRKNELLERERLESCEACKPKSKHN